MKTAIVHVTEEAIARDRHQCNDCPVFDALLDAGVPVQAVHHSCWVDSRNGYHDFPPIVADWIYLYDLERLGWPTDSKPFSFEISWPWMEL